MPLVYLFAFFSYLIVLKQSINLGPFIKFQVKSMLLKFVYQFEMLIPKNSKGYNPPNPQTI